MISVIRRCSHVRMHADPSLQANNQLETKAHCRLWASTMRIIVRKDVTGANGLSFVR